MTSGRPSEVSMHRLPDGLAVAAACVFVFLAAYRIEVPGLYMDEVDFVNAAQGAPDNTMIHMRLGSVPLFIMAYLGALKAWIYAPIFRLFGVSALTIRLPVILIAAVTLLIFYRAMREKLGAVWAAIAIWIMAVDPANLFPSRLDWGPTVLMHFFQAPERSSFDVARSLDYIPKWVYRFRMQLHNLKSVLRNHPGTSPRFVLPDGDYIPAHAHVTEVGHSVKNFIDCGGVAGKVEAVLLQTHVGDDIEHRLTSERFDKILQLGDRVLPHDDLDVEVEYDCCVVAQYPIVEAKRNGKHLDLILENKHTQCLARERAKTEAESPCCGVEACC